MAGLALKAISYGAEHIPDKLFEAIPGGYFRSQQEKEAKKRRKEEKKREKRRAQSEGRGRRQRSPSLTESDYYSSDYYSEDSDYDRRRRNRRSSDTGRGRDRGRERDRDRKHRHHHHKDRSWSRGLDHHDSPPYADRSKSLGPTQGLHIPPPPVQPFPPAHLAGENYAHPQPYNAAHNHYAAKPYNPADYVPGAMNVSEYTNGQPVPVNTQALAQAPAASQPPAAGYYGTQFPPPPSGSRSSRGSSVDSRGLQSGPYIPHSNIQAIPVPNATAGAPGHSPYGARFPSAANTPPFGHTPPQYRPQNSSPYQPNYSPSYPMQQPHGYGSQPISRHGSIHSGSPNVYGGQVGDGARSHDRHRRHSIPTNPDSRMAYRTPYRSRAGSSTTSTSNSVRGSRADAIHELPNLNQGDGIDDHGQAFAVAAPRESEAGVAIEAASEGVNTAEALKKRHQTRAGRRSHGSRRAIRSAPVDGYGSA
ncbi:uncharacterized protein BKCO1_18000144 [Diplodia corticola]|uniref:Uncharacterized protein n=1 Tax=Diplodia corticola TaxID=236234 RepID=A0A1J9R3T6_9PEZI|nr:uncharacterized protein BKCO1_18000144 [Diplodia corticola]OJD35241.1 hypothetical protein BKCO1_18000144 [Diplodia corticola]